MGEGVGDGDGVGVTVGVGVIMISPKETSGNALTFVDIIMEPKEESTSSGTGERIPSVAKTVAINSDRKYSIYSS